MPHTGLQPRSYIGLNDVMWCIMGRLYQGSPKHIQLTISLQRRNDEIRRRYIEGTESIPDLAKVFDLSNARVHQILHHK